MKGLGSRLAMARHKWLAVVLTSGMIAQGALFGPALASEPAKGGQQIGVGVLMQLGTGFLSATGCGGPAPSAVVAPFEQRLVELINAERRANDVPPLKRVLELDDAARYHAADMGDDDYFGHDTMDRTNGALDQQCTWIQRVATFYPDGVTYGQNIAMNHPDAQSVFDGWIASQSTRANLLSDTVREMGVGYHEGPDASNYWVLNIGKRADVFPLVIADDAVSTCHPEVPVYIHGRWQEMQLKIDAADWLPWEPFQNMFTLRLSGYGSHDVQAQVRRADGTVVAGPMGDSINLTRCGEEEGASRGSTIFIPFAHRPLPYSPLIVFESDRDGDWEIYLMNPDGTNQVNLTDNPDADDRYPVPSRDGSVILFESDRDGDVEIYSMQVSYHPELAVGAITQLTENDAYDGKPAFAPHEWTVAFESDRDDPDGLNIYAMRVDGSLQTRMTSGTGIDSSPTWSPITTTIAFVTDRDRDEEIYAITGTETIIGITPGPGEYNLSQSPRRPDRDPDWSRDGRSLAFATERQGHWDIYRMNADGNGQIGLTQAEADDRGPRWSRSGNWIAFASNRDGNWEIYVMAADGSNLRRLTNNLVDDDGYMFDIDWSPDDGLLAFSALNRMANQDIYVVDLDGSGRTRITTALGDDMNPRWIRPR